MSDIRTKLLLGTTLASVAMIFVMAVGVDAFDTKLTTAVQSSGIMGHVTAMAVHPDGSTSYAQGDNLIVTATLSAAQVQLHDRNTATAGGVFDCMRLGGCDGTGNDLAGATELTVTGQSCDTDGDFDIDSDGVGDIIAEFTILAGDLTAGAVTISDVVLENSGNTVLSHVALAADVPAVENTIVTITFEMTLAATP